MRSFISAFLRRISFDIIKSAKTFPRVIITASKKSRYSLLPNLDCHPGIRAVRNAIYIIDTAISTILGIKAHIILFKNRSLLNIITLTTFISKHDRYTAKCGISKIY